MHNQDEQQSNTIMVFSPPPKKYDQVPHHLRRFKTISVEPGVIEGIRVRDGGILKTRGELEEQEEQELEEDEEEDPGFQPPILARSSTYHPLLPQSLVQSIIPKDIRMRIASFLESDRFHHIVLLLLGLDLLLTIIGLLIASFQKSCAGISEYHIRSSSSSSSSCPLEPVLVTFRWISTAILISFGIEIITRLIIFGYKYFTKSLLHFIDACLVIASIALRIIAFAGLPGSIGSLVIVFRAWRAVRLIDNAALEMVVHMRKEENEMRDRYRKKIHKLKQEIRELEGL